MSDLEQIAATLREKYWTTYFAEAVVSPWETTTEGNRRAWIDVALLSREMWEGIPR